jgi:hypothetical protein
MLQPIPENTRISISIGTMVNPGSTEQTEAYGFSIRSDTWYEVAEVLEPIGGVVQMTEPSLITDYQFEVFDDR